LRWSQRGARIETTNCPTGNKKREDSSASYVQHGRVQPSRRRCRVGADPNHPEGEIRARSIRLAERDLPVALSEDEITAAFIPFASRLELELPFHLLLRRTEPCRR
jgi:hypothetical protein